MLQRLARQVFAQFVQLPGFADADRAALPADRARQRAFPAPLALAGGELEAFFGDFFGVVEYDRRRQHVFRRPGFFEGEFRAFAGISRLAPAADVVEEPFRFEAPHHVEGADAPLDAHGQRRQRRAFARAASAQISRRPRPRSTGPGSATSRGAALGMLACARRRAGCRCQSPSCRPVRRCRGRG